MTEFLLLLWKSEAYIESSQTSAMEHFCGNG